MKNTFTLFTLFFLFSATSKAGIKIWIGPDGGSWSDINNWSPVLTPLFSDTVIINTNGSINVDVNPNIAGLQILNNVNVILSGSGARLITIGNGASAAMVFRIDLGSMLTLQGTASSTGVSIQTYGSFTTNSAKVSGTLILGAYNCTWTINSFPGSFTNTDINGIVRVAATNTGSVLSTGTSATLRFLSGSLLDWQRSGGSAPNANFQNGSVINVTGIVGSNMNFNSSALYNGLLIWNCPSQTINGGSALLLPAGNTVMDSVRIVNTGSGSIRFATNPNGYTIGSLEVQGGILELSAPNAATNSLTDTITNELKISGGIVYGNATFPFDNLGAAYPNTLFVKGNFIQTGGNFDFTNRTAGNAPGGSFVMNVKGDVSQTSGLITATQGFSTQNQLNMIGTSFQNLGLRNMTGLISLSINNLAGVNLQNTLTLPYFLNLQQGYLQLNSFDATVTSTQLTQAAVTPKPRIVTNGLGKLIISNITNGSLQIFPVAPFANGYNQVTVGNGEAIAKTFRIRVEYGLNPLSGSVDINKIVNRTWNISATTPTTPNLIGLKFHYADSEKVAGSGLDPAAPMELGHFINSWNIDPPGNIIPIGGPVNYTVGLFTPVSLDSSFVIGNIGFINAITNQYIFNGTGNWNIASNWVNNIIPPSPLPSGEEIVVDPVSGNCILNIPQTISPGGKITVKQGKNLLLPGNLTIQ